MNQPFIKWTGSKRPIAEKIISFFPKEIDTYYEPFLGSGSVFFSLLKNQSIKVKKFYLSDKNKSLMELFKILKNNPDSLIYDYEEKWHLLQENCSHDKKSNYFYIVRDFYNEKKSPLDFYFLTRTCYNGTIRYNQKGEFNTSHHFGRPGMHPKKVKDIINYYNILMKDKDIVLSCESFENIKPDSEKDVIYIDPPYSDSDTLYFGYLDYSLFFNWVSNLSCYWFMNFNGFNKKDNETNNDFPYEDKIILDSGLSSFSRMKKQKINVGEYFYIGKKHIPC